MIRTFVYFPEELDDQIIKLATRTKRSKGSVIREAIQKGLTSFKKQALGGADALLRISELGKRVNASGPKDLSKNMDKYLWQTQK